MKGRYYSGTVKKTITIKTSSKKAWNKLSNIAGLHEWVIDVKKTTYMTKQKRGVGAIRKIVFCDGSVVEEHIVAWDNGKSFTYIATDGLPLRAYIATISIKSIRNAAQITWQSYFNSKKMSRKKFAEFVSFMNLFYRDSLDNLKKILEKT